MKMTFQAPIFPLKTLPSCRLYVYMSKAHIKKHHLSGSFRYCHGSECVAIVMR